MSLNTLVSRTSYPGAGSVGPYAVPFRILAAADLLVVIRDSLDVETVQVLGTDYTVAGVGDAQGTITLTVALAAGKTLSIRRAPDLTQPTSLRNQASYFPATIEDELDRLAMQLQRLEDEVSRSARLKESYDPNGIVMQLKPETGKALVWQSATQLGNSQLDAGAIALPGGGRTVASLSAYILNNAVFNVKDYGAKGDGVTDDSVSVKAAIAAANAAVGINGAFKSQIGAVLYFPHGTYLLKQQLTPFPGVSMMGEGLWNTILMFSMADTVDAIVWDSATAGYVPLQYQAHGWGGFMQDIKVTTVDFSDAARSCRTMVKVMGMVDFNFHRVMLAQSRGRLLHLENVINVTLHHFSGQQCHGDAGVWIGSGGSVTTTVRGFGVWVSQCDGGPNFDVGGLSIDFYGLISESAGATGVLPGLAGAYGIRIRSGRCALYSPYFEDNADHDIYVGSDAVAAVTSVVVTNPTIIVGANKIGLKGGVYLDQVQYASIIGGDYSATSRPLQITANCGFVDAKYYAPGKPPLLTSGAHWRTKADLNYVTGPTREQQPQRLTKANIAPAGTAVLTIPLLPNQAGYISVFARVLFRASGNNQALIKIDVGHHSDGFANGGAVVTALKLMNAGNFNVVIGDFVATFSAGNIIITYTCSNPLTNNDIEFVAEGVGLGGDISVA